MAVALKVLNPIFSISTEKKPEPGEVMRVGLKGKHVSKQDLSGPPPKRILSRLEYSTDESKNGLVFQVLQASWFVSSTEPD